MDSSWECFSVRADGSGRVPESWASFLLCALRTILSHVRARACPQLPDVLILQGRRLRFSVLSLPKHAGLNRCPSACIENMEGQNLPGARACTCIGDT
jgi:hypothetical protein